MRLTGFFLIGLLVVSVAIASSSARIISAYGIRVTVPAGWQRIEAAGDGPVTDPRTLLVVGTTGVRPRVSRCQIAAYRLPPQGAVVVVVGWRRLSLSGAQAQKPGRAPLKKLIGIRRPSFECFAGRGAAASLVLAGKAYQVNVMVGDRASRRRLRRSRSLVRSVWALGENCPACPSVQKCLLNPGPNQARSDERITQNR